MEASEVPMIVQWRIYLQSLDFKIEHIKGRDNTVADALSRLLMLVTVYDELDCPEAQHAILYILEEENCTDKQVHLLAGVFDKPTNEGVLTPRYDTKLTSEQLFQEVHNGQQGHWGVEETYKRLNKLAPGYGLSVREVSELVCECVNCQKNRRERSNRLIPIPRTLKPPMPRTAIGVDAVAITPPGKTGLDHLIVVVNLFIKLTSLYPVQGCSAKNLAYSIWKYWCTYGHTDLIISDQGPDLKSDLMSELVQLMGMRHVFSIVDKHANGVERVNKEVVRHLRCLVVWDRNIRDVFDDPTMIPSVQYILNSHVSSETGFSLFELTFGSADKIYGDLLKDCSGRPVHTLFSKLNENLTFLRAAIAEFQQSLISARVPKDKEAVQNRFQEGDLVLFDAGPKPHPKMASRHKGPYEVVRQHKNDVQVRDLVTGVVLEFSVVDLEPFFGVKTDAVTAARRDQEDSEADNKGFSDNSQKSAADAVIVKTSRVLLRGKPALLEKRSNATYRLKLDDGSLSTVFSDEEYIMQWLDRLDYGFCSHKSCTSLPISLCSRNVHWLCEEHFCLGDCCVANKMCAAAAADASATNKKPIAGDGPPGDGSPGDPPPLGDGFPGDGSPGDDSPGDGPPGDGPPGDGPPGDGSLGDGPPLGDGSLLTSLKEKSDLPRLPPLPPLVHIIGKSSGVTQAKRRQNAERHSPMSTPNLLKALTSLFTGLTPEQSSY
jgi:hypothetical protein